jgi:FkbM family methyltransferase
MRILFITPHLSTGGLPQYLEWSIRELIDAGQDAKEIYVIEYSDIAPDYVVQKNRIRDLLSDRLITFYGDESRKRILLKKTLVDIKPDVIHMEEIPELWLNESTADVIYSSDRSYKIIETSHDSSYDLNEKVYFPDGFAVINAYHAHQFFKFGIPLKTVEYTIPPKERPDRNLALAKLSANPSNKHVLSVGLFTPRKNQAELFKIAQMLIDYSIQFHFVGNNAPNFESYWKPLFNNLPKNCVIWGERKDPEIFYSACDLFYFASKPVGKDQESNPIVIKEAMSWHLPMLLYRHETYCGAYDDIEGLTFLTEDLFANCKLLLNKLGIEDVSKIKNDPLNIAVHFAAPENKIYLTYNELVTQELLCGIRDLDTNLPIYDTKMLFAQGMVYWINPCQAIDFEKLYHFNGFIVELYSKDKRLVFQKELRVKNNPPFTKTKFEVYPLDALYYNFFEFYELKLYDGMIREGDIVLDIGASSGTFTNYALDQGASHSYAVEPFPRSLNNMRSTFGKDNRVTIIDKAISDTSGKKTFYMGSDNSTMGSLYKQEDKFKPILEVDAITLDELFEIYKLPQIDLMKIDTEGSEYAIMDSIKSLDIERVIIEFHYNRGEVRKLVEKLVSLDYEYEIHENSSYRPGGPDLYFGNITAYKKGTSKPVPRTAPVNLLPKIKSDKPSICHVPLGQITIPPKSWGATERIIWAYKQEFEKRGYFVDMQYPMDIHREYDIVQAYVANQALMLKARGIPYYLTLIDHQVYNNGKDSKTFQDTLEAMKHSILTFIAAPFLIDYFAEIEDKIRPISFGVDTDFFQPAQAKPPLSLLCVGNTLMWDKGELIDRKGFTHAVEAANKLKVPITIAGPENNNAEFVKQLKEKDLKFMYVYDPSDEDLRYLYQTHSMLVHPSLLEGAHPPLVVMEAWACGLPVISTCAGEGSIDSKLDLTDVSADAIIEAVNYVAHNHDKLCLAARKTVMDKFTWVASANKIEKYYKETH